MRMATTLDRSIHAENKIWRSNEEPDRRHYRTRYQSVLVFYHTAASAGHYLWKHTAELKPYRYRKTRYKIILLWRGTEAECLFILQRRGEIYRMKIVTVMKGAHRLVTEELEDHQQKWRTKFKINEVFFMQNSQPETPTDIGLAKRHWRCKKQ